MFYQCARARETWENQRTYTQQNRNHKAYPVIFRPPNTPRRWTNRRTSQLLRHTQRLTCCRHDLPCQLLGGHFLDTTARKKWYLLNLNVESSTRETALLYFVVQHEKKRWRTLQKLSRQRFDSLVKSRRDHRRVVRVERIHQ